MKVSLKEQSLIRAVHAFEDIGFMAWHARVLNELTKNPMTIREISRRTGLYQYHVVGVVQDLLGLQLVEYTRYGVQVVDHETMLLQLIDCCEGDRGKHAYDWEAAFEVVNPRVVALKKKWGVGE